MKNFFAKLGNRTSRGLYSEIEHYFRTLIINEALKVSQISFFLSSRYVFSSKERMLKYKWMEF